MTNNATLKGNRPPDDMLGFSGSLPTSVLPADRVMSLGSICTWEWDLDAGAVLYSGAWGPLLALTAEGDIKGGLDFLLSRVSGDDLEILETALAKIISGEWGELDIPVLIKRHDNTCTWILLRGKIAPECSGRRIFAGIGLNISRLRLSNRFCPPHADDAQSTYQSMLDNSPVHIVRFDRHMFPLYMNPAMYEFSRYSPEQMGGLTAEEAGYDPGELGYLQEKINEVFDTGKIMKFRWTTSRPRMDAPKTTGDYCLWPEFDADGKVKTVICQFYDLTRQIAQEENTRFNEMRFSSLHQLTHMDDVPEDDVMFFVAEKIAELTKSAFSHLHILPSALQSAERIIWSSSHRALFAPEELNSFDPSVMRGEFGMDVAGGGEPVMTCVQNHPVDPATQRYFKDRLFVSRFACVPAMEGNQAALIAAVYNKDFEYSEADARQLELFITGAWHIIRRRHYVSALKNAVDEVQLASEAKNRFLASVSHELRTPLNGMLSMLQLLEFSNLTPKQAEYAKRANNTGKTLMRIISDIIDYSRMESGRFDLDMAPFDIAECLRGSLKIFYADASRKKLALRLSLKGEFPEMIVGDEARIRQIVFNLVGNALKFTDSGEIEVICKAKAQGPGMSAIELTVRDTGIGIPEEMQRKVFDAFTQVDPLATRKHQGSGLGLGIVRQLLQRMGGAVSLKSKINKGTTITCSLVFPIATQEEIDARRLALSVSKAEKTPFACPPMIILVAEDDQVSRMAMKLFLEKLGHTAVCVSNGREALEALRLYRFDCLITDVLMPEMDGIDITMHIRNRDFQRFRPSPETIMAVKEGDLPEPKDIPAGDKGLLDIDAGLPIVAVSAHAMKGDRERFLEHGMDYYLSKPVQIECLRGTLAQLHKERLLPKATNKL